MTDAAVDLQAKLANVLWRTGRRGQAMAAFREALRLASPGDTVRRAHLHTRLGRLEMADRRYQAAEESFDAAEALLGEDPGQQDAATVAEWLEMMVDGRAGLYTFRNEPELALAVLEEVRPALEASGNPARRYGFYLHLALARVMQNGFRVDETDIATMRAGLAAAAEGDEEKDAGYATYFLGRFLWLHGDLEAAREQMERSLAMAERIGESNLLGQSLLGLAQTALRRHETEAVRALMTRIAALVDAMASYEYTAGAKACLAWLAWQDGRPDDVITLSDEVAELMATTVGSGFYQGLIYLWPLTAVRLDAGQLAEAVAAARQLLRAARPRLTGDLESALAEAGQAWDQGDAARAREQLAAAVALARDLGYC